MRFEDATSAESPNNDLLNAYLFKKGQLPEKIK